VNIIARIDNNTENEGQTGIVDSGANIDVINMDTATQLDRLQLTEYDEDDKKTQQEIEFGIPDNKAAIVGWMRPQGLLGRIAVTHKISENLLRVRGFIERGYRVEFVGNHLYIRGQEGNTVAEGWYNNNTGYYHVNIAELMR
jgi:hypothetical protein